MEKNIKVRCVKHTDVRGKEQLYIIAGEEKTVIINVGEKTFNGIKELLQEEVVEIPEVINEEKEMREGKKNGK